MCVHVSGGVSGGGGKCVSVTLATQQLQVLFSYRCEGQLVLYWWELHMTFTTV